LSIYENLGPIVRISPFELHVNDPDFYDELYVGSSVRKTNKYLWALRMFGPPNTLFGTPDHDLHRFRRSALSPFFSQASVQRLEPTVQLVIDKLLSRLQKIQGSGSIVNLIDVFSALTGDVVSQYAFAKPFGLMDQPDFAQDWHQAIMDISQNGYLLEHFTWTEPLFRSLPPWLVRFLSPKTMPLLAMQKDLETQVNVFKSDFAKGRKIKGQRTIFYDILANDQGRPEEKESAHLGAEALGVMAAGTGTTAHLLAVLSFHLLDNPDILAKMQSELKSVMLDKDARPQWLQLEQLPYLNAIITESLRVSYGVTHRLQRISPDVALQYKEWTIPVGTPVGMTALVLHNNPHNFPNPSKFNPDRWLQASGKKLSKYMVAFSKGSRQCIGMK
jgi:cytochrome P450